MVVFCFSKLKMKNPIMTLLLPTGAGAPKQLLLFSAGAGKKPEVNLPCNGDRKKPEKPQALQWGISKGDFASESLRDSTLRKRPIMEFKKWQNRVLTIQPPSCLAIQVCHLSSTHPLPLPKVTPVPNEVLVSHCLVMSHHCLFLQGPAHDWHWCLLARCYKHALQHIYSTLCQGLVLVPGVFRTESFKTI